MNQPKETSDPLTSSKDVRCSLNSSPSSHGKANLAPGNLVDKKCYALDATYRESKATKPRL